MGRVLLAEAIESALRTAGLNHSCAGCGGLRRGSPGVLFIGERTEPLRCPTCRLCVDERGEAVGTIMADGRVSLTIMRVEGPMPEPERPRTARGYAWDART